MAPYPCPCCGHRTLPEGPGDYELCPVCFWEDDPAQLRWPSRAGGANGVSLVDAQAAYRRHGTMSRVYRRRVRPPRADELLDAGWRPFDPDLDWTDPRLDEVRWPRNPEALYYWRATYWHGDPDRVPALPREETAGDRLVAHVLTAVPEAGSAVAAVEERYGVAAPMSCCEGFADLAVAAYRAADDDLGLRLATAVSVGLDESSACFAPNCVTIGFLESEHWHDPGLRSAIESWPAPLRGEAVGRIRHRDARAAEQDRRSAEWIELLRTSRGQSVADIVDRLRALAPPGLDDPHSELTVQTTARVLSDPWWLWRHPRDSWLLARRHRHLRPVWATLRALRRLRVSG